MTDNDDTPHRPNAKYNLSKSDAVNPDEEQKLIFYYNREHRLAKAPRIVKDLYKEQKRSRFSLIRPLIADKPRAILFFTIVLICVAIIIFSLLGYFSTSYSLGGNKIDITGTAFEGTTIILIRKNTEKASAYTGAVDIAVSPAMQGEDEYPVFYHRIFFTLTEEEEYRFVVPFDPPELLMALQAEKFTLQLKLKPE
jgi:hypothetical protein